MLRGTCGAHGRDEIEHKRFLLENLKGRKKSLGKPRQRWEDSVKMDLKEVG
jgi:hypothetical protein